MSTSDKEQPDPVKLAELLQMSDDRDRVWSPEELSAILQHQLATAIEYDLTAMDQGEARRLRTNAAAEGLLLESFADLLHHKRPPRELLNMAKRFAKANRNHPDSSLPTEVATLLYYACIAAAMVHRRERITELGDSALREGFSWSQAQSWVDSTTATLFDQALTILGESRGDRS